MATESPIRMLGGTEKWPPLKQSTRFGSSSSKIIKDLGLLINDQRFQCFEKDVPSRCESAPPSMESSKDAVENMFSHQKSTFKSRSVYHPDPSSSSHHFTGDVLDRRFADALNLRGRDPFVPTCSTDSDGKMTFHAKCVDDHGKLPRNIHPIHEEESEDDRSSEQSSCLSNEKSSFLGYHSGSVDATQENFIPAASSTYDQCHSSYKSMEETLISYTELHPQDTLSNSTSTAGTNDPSLDDTRQASPLDLAITAANADERDRISTTGDHFEAGKNVNATTGSNSDLNKLHKQDQLISQSYMHQQQIGPQESNPSRVQGFSLQMIYQGMSNSYGSLNQFHRGSSSVSMAEIQPVLLSSGFTPPLYFYPNLQPQGFFSPQYSMGGYTFNSAVHPSYLPGFPYQGAIPLAYDSVSFPTSGVSNGGNLNAYDTQNLKFYSQVGEYMQFPQLPVRDMYGAYGHFGHQAPGDGAILNQEDSRDLRKRTNVTLSNDRKSQNSAHAGYNRSNIQRGTMSSHYSFGRPTNVGPLEQFPTAKPVGGTNSPGEGYKTTYSHSCGNPRKTYALQSQNWSDTVPFSFLEELKSDKGHRFELSDIAGHICEFSGDQHGSRFIQQKLVTCSVEEKASVFGEVVPNAFKLMTDVFGNYVIQKLFEYGSPDQRKDLANKLEGQILPLSLQMYGCRVIQKAIEVIDLEQKVRLVKELDGHVIRCVRDQNGNHVIQKCIESIPIDKVHFIISSFRGQVATLSKHPYGCRVVQRVLEHCKDEIQTQFILDELLHSVCFLAQDQYGNYVTQHVIGRGKPQERRAIIEKLSGSVVQLSQHKFASNVIEKCLECGDSTSRGILIKEIIGHGDKNDNLLIMMKDQYANYVIQKILQKCTSDQREVLLGQIRNHLTTLRKYTYGKHIIAQFEQLCDEVIHTPES
ncbi:hypothetical protein ACS0TY_016781 [Phlomoides rotata]